MPRYFFDLDGGGRVTPDAEGTELPDLPAARAQALHMLGEMAKAEMRDDDTRSQQRTRDHSAHGFPTRAGLAPSFFFGSAWSASVCHCSANFSQAALSFGSFDRSAC